MTDYKMAFSRNSLFTTLAIMLTSAVVYQVHWLTTGSIEPNSPSTLAEPIVLLLAAGGFFYWLIAHAFRTPNNPETASLLLQMNIIIYGGALLPILFSAAALIVDPKLALIIARTCTVFIFVALMVTIIDAPRHIKR